MTHEELDAMDDKIAAAVYEVSAGREDGDEPSGREVREAFKARGLMIILLDATAK